MKVYIEEKWLDILSVLTDEVRLEVLDAIMEYSIRGVQCQLRPIARKVFDRIKLDIDKQRDHQQDISNKRKKAAEKRYYYSLDDKQLHAKACKSTKSNANARLQTAKASSNDVKAEEIMQMQEKPHLSVSSTRVIINNNNIKADNKNNNQEKKKENGEKETKKTCISSPSQDETVDVRKFIAYFNKTLEAAGCTIPHRCTYTERRRKAITCRAAEHGKESLSQMVKKASNSSFLNGNNSRSWVATLDWLLCPNNFVKVIEGNYDNKSKTDYGNQWKTSNADRKRGTEATRHSDEEY